MSKQKGLTPKLRFPEFRGKGEWEEKPLGRVVDIASGQVDPTEPPYCDLPHVGGENIESHTGAIRDVKTASELQLISGKYAFDENDVLYSKIRPALNKVAAPDFKGICSADIYPVRPSNRELRRQYLVYLLLSEAFLQYATKHADRSKIPKVNRDALLAYTVSIPAPVEQQKIADCLSSLDGLLAAERRKLESLRAYKKGLMQQLFPRHGETTPRLRFPEFRGKGYWEEKKAGSLFANRIANGEEGLPIYSVTMHDGMVRRDSIDRNIDDIEEAAGNKKACKNDIAYNMMRMWQGALGVAPEDCLVSPAYIVLSPEKGVVSSFFEYFFKSPESLLLLTSYSRGLTKDRLRLYFDDFARIPLRCPNGDEQQRIADCLVALDARIATENEKLAALRAHKKGLMQQLFPWAAEA